MAVNKRGHRVRFSPKEVASTQSRRNVTKRVGELPSLRYGPVGARTSTAGPLRITDHYQPDTLPRCIRRMAPDCCLHEDRSFKVIRPARRVRFALPPSDATHLAEDVVDAGIKAPASKGKRLRTKTTASRPTLFSYRPYEGERTRVEISCDRAHEEHVSVPVTASPGYRRRIHPTGIYVRGTLSPTANAAPQADLSPEGTTLLRAAREGDDLLLRELLRKALLVGIAEGDLNAADCSGRTVLSYIASNGAIELLELILQLPNLDPNKADNEGNTPLHFAAQAGQVECLNCLLSRCRGIEIDARNHLGFTPLMKAALQGRNKCAKLLLFAGANPTLRDNGRGFRADQWARFCGRYVCADVIEKHARQRLLERSTSYGNWGGELELGTRVVMGKVVPVPPITQQQSHGLKSKLRKVFRTSSGPNQNADAYSSARLVTQLTSAALCASSPVLPSGPGTIPPVVKSLIRPLTVPRLQITLVNNNGDHPNRNLTNNGILKQTGGEVTSKPPPSAPYENERATAGSTVKSARGKKIK